MSTEKMIQIYLSIGSNLLNREENFLNAINELSKEIKIIKVSSIYETSPMYLKDQPDFLNGVIMGETEFDCHSLLSFTQNIEIRLGRERKKEVINGPRSIDIDILLYGNLIINSNILTIPHPKIEERKFVLIPLIEISPNLINPIVKNLYSDKLEQINSQNIHFYCTYENLQGNK